MWLNSPTNPGEYKRKYKQVSPLKPHIELGAYGWQHLHWRNTFYPADLPVDWQLTYYSNEFNAVLVPADYWQTKQALACGCWVDAVHPGFQFYVECHAAMLDFIPLAELTENLKNLGSRLSALVFLEQQQMPATLINQFVGLIDTLAVDVFGADFLPEGKAQNIWRVQNPQPSAFAWIEDDLTDLKSARKITEDFVNHSLNEGFVLSDAAIIVAHPGLQASDLGRFRSLLEIMGY